MRSVSIHIGVNRPAGRDAGRPLQYSEAAARRMAEVAVESGYGSVLLLRGAAATADAVHEAFSGAATALSAGDILFVSFSGHGTQEPDRDGDEGQGWDEAWCLADGPLLDDKLAGYWRLFAGGVRILVITESCYGGGMGRLGEDDLPLPGASRSREPARVLRTPPPVMARRPTVLADSGPCIAEAPGDPDGIAASLLLISASGEEQLARDGLFTRHLLGIWEDGFRGTYCDLYRQVRARVLAEAAPQEPRIMMLGAPDLDFPMERAFHLSAGTRRSAPYR